MEASVIMHFYNEEMLIVDWILHHRHFFDRAILINHRSTDRSVELATKVLPSGWSIVNTSLPNFDAPLVDQEVMAHERTLPGWKMALNVTEYLFCPDFRDRLSRVQPEVMAVGIRPVCLVDKEPDIPLETPIWKNRTYGFLNYGEGNPSCRTWRFIHRAPDGQYTVGRHDTHLQKIHDVDMYHLHLLYSPWPQCKPRKLQIQSQIPESNKQARMGFQHIVTEQELEQGWQNLKPLAGDLLQIPRYKECYDHLLKLMQ